MEGVTAGQGDLGGDAQGNECAEEEDTRVGFWISDNDSALLIICGNTDSNFFALDPKIVSKLGNLRFGNSKIRETG
jgi:hypothetical protein